MSKIISIITPSFNQSKYIGKTIESIFAQVGDFYIDYIIMDAKSTDRTLDIIREYEAMLFEKSQMKEINGNKYYKNSTVGCNGISFRWESEEDSGFADAINKGIKIMKGSVFSYINSDDMYEDDALRKVLEAFEESSDVDIVYGNAFLVNEEGEIIKLYPVKDISRNNLLDNCFLSQASVFMRSSVVLKAGNFNENISNSIDYEYWLRLQHLGMKFKFIRNVLSSTRLYGDTKTAKNRKTILLECLAFSEEYGGKPSVKHMNDLAGQVSIVGRLINKVAAIVNKGGEIKIKLISRLYYKFKKDEVSQMRERIFQKT